MARITRVNKAQQRYVTVPVIDPETGQQKQTPVMKNGKQRVTKKGQPIFLSVTVADKTKPLPNRKCGKCSKEITVGSPYKHISPRSGPYGGHTLYRCASCPDWHVWEYSSSLSARVAEISYDFSQEADGWDSSDAVQDSLTSTAERVREIAQEKEESADNIESGFQHETQMSQELRDVSEQLNSWADEIEGAEIPDYPEPEEDDCDECEGNGVLENEEYGVLSTEAQELLERIKHYLLFPWPDTPSGFSEEVGLTQTIGRKIIYVLQRKLDAINERLVDEDAMVSCDTCDGTGRVEPDEPTEEQVDEWRSEVESAVSIVDECPV
jgi:hypothetical protein